jgi:hypothetical protein
MEVEDIVTVEDFVSALNTFLTEPNFIPKHRIFSPGVSYGFVFTGKNPFKIDKLGRRDFRIEKALSMFAEHIEGFEGDIIDLEDWFESLEGFDEIIEIVPKTLRDEYTSQERLLGKLNHLAKLKKFKKFDNRDKVLETYEKARLELPDLLEDGIDLNNLRKYTILRLPEAKGWLNREEI